MSTILQNAPRMVIVKFRTSSSSGTQLTCGITNRCQPRSVKPAETNRQHVQLPEEKHIFAHCLYDLEKARIITFELFQQSTLSCCGIFDIESASGRHSLRACSSWLSQKHSRPQWSEPPTSCVALWTETAGVHDGSNIRVSRLDVGNGSKQATLADVGWLDIRERRPNLTASSVCSDDMIETLLHGPVLESDLSGRNVGDSMAPAHDAIWKSVKQHG